MIPCNTCDFLILRKDFLLHCCTTNHKVRLLELYLISATFILSFFNSGVSKKTQPTSCSTIGELRNVVSHFMAGHLYIFWLAAMLINAQSFKNSPKDATLTKFYWTLVSVCIVHLMISLAELNLDKRYCSSNAVQEGSLVTMRHFGLTLISAINFMAASIACCFLITKYHRLVKMDTNK